MQEQLRASQEQKQTIEKQEKELEKVKEALGIALSKERVASEIPAEHKPEEPVPKPEKPAPKSEKSASKPEKPVFTPEEPAPMPDEKKEEKPKEGAWSKTIEGEAETGPPHPKRLRREWRRTTRLPGVLGNPVESSTRGTSRSGSAIVARRPAGGTQSIASDP